MSARHATDRPLFSDFVMKAWTVLADAIKAIDSQSDANPDGLPYEVKPFTIEEARESARANATQAAKLRSDPDDERTSYTERMADEHSRVAATLREYVRLKENITMIAHASEGVASRFNLGSEKGKS